MLTLLTNPLVLYDICVCELGEGPSRGLLRDCENFADGPFAALLLSSYVIFYPEEEEGKETVQENTLIVAADEGLDENKGTL